MMPPPSPSPPSPLAPARLGESYIAALVAAVWPILFIVYCWAMKSTLWVEMRYAWQDLDSPMALVWYPAVFAFHAVSYFIFVGLSKLKLRRVDRGGCCCFWLFPSAVKEVEAQTSTNSSTSSESRA
jgi:hypothetical protein